jgi:(E)-4-hydroxy-3-methyl-but-2-enyl pyrophosphate reductase
MKIAVAKTAGFCMGVRRAVELALDAPAKYPQPIYTFGPLIHNPQVLALFAEKGVTVLDRIPVKGSGTVLVRAHGIPPGTHQALKAAGFTVINATCPRVIKVQSIIKNHARKGYAIIIVGEKDHPEVVGLQGYAGDRGYVVAGLDALAALPPFGHAIIVAQTTQNLREYRQIKTWASATRPRYKVYDTICDSTEKRQAEVRDLARDADAVVVVGGKESGNTRRLAAIVEAVGKKAYHVETEQELDGDALSRLNTIGITAGASTPSWIIKRVLQSIERMPAKKYKGLYSFWLRLQRILLLTNIYVAFGAGCLAFATILLQGLTDIYPAAVVAVLYVMSMHILNNLTGRAESKYNDPERERFYSKYKPFLIAMAMISGALGLVVAYGMGQLPFWVLFSMSLLGLSYNLRLVPFPAEGTIKFRAIREVPGSKTILIALAWGTVTALLPALAAKDGQWVAGSAAFLWATGIVFCRTAFFDVLDIQGDRIVGKETLPTLIGPKRSFILLKAILGALVALLPISGALDVLMPLAYIMVIPPLMLMGIIHAHERGNVLPGMRMEFRVESLFVLCGILALVCSTVLRVCPRF